MQTQPADPIIAELRAVRNKHAAQFGYDVKTIFRDIQARPLASGRRYVRYRARRAVPESENRTTP